MKRQTLSVLAAILVLTAIALWLALPSNPGIHIHFWGINYDRDVKISQGLDLQGGIQVLLEADLPAETEVDAEAMSTARKIIEGRVNGLGVTEPLVQLQGSRRIIVELPGLEREEQALSTIQETGLMEFIDCGSQFISQGTTVQTDYIPGQPIADDAGTPQTSEEGMPIYHTVMTGEALKNAWLGTDNSKGYVEYLIGFELNPDWASVFSDYTGAHINQFLAIVLDKEVISCPRIDSRIPDGKGTITGKFTRDEAESLAVQLRYGALPIPLRVESNQKIGPSLGQESVQQSIKAGIVGLSAVFLFMLIYYRLPGLLADLSLIIYGLLNLAIFKLGSMFMIVLAAFMFLIYMIERRDNWLLWISVGMLLVAILLNFRVITLTLPGIAGFLLSTGMAVDANILIFERMKEELRAGRTLQAALNAGFDRAWTSIWDSQVSTLIICAILYIFGSNFGASIVKGFAITLSIGTVVNLFTAITVTRILMSATFEAGQEEIAQKRWLLGI
jgi:protein-export membrane protein SecD